MRREPGLTLCGALEILGHHDRSRIDRLNAVLGGVILASGVAAGVAAFSGAVLPAAGLWIAIFGWTGQKDVAVDLLRKVVDSITGKLNEVSRYERGQLIVAAHTSIVIAAFFEALRQQLDKDFYDSLKISDAEKETLMSGHIRSTGQTLVESLYASEVPTPSAALGFEENVSEVVRWLVRFDSIFRDFLGGLEIADHRLLNFAPVTGAAVERYRSYYIELAAKVPEFAIWAMLGEHAATRSAVREQTEELAEQVNDRTAALIREQSSWLTGALNQNTAALARVEAFLALTSGQAAIVTDLRAIVERANDSILSQPIIPADDSHHSPHLTIPSIGQMYINPRFRVIQYGPDVSVADAEWWIEQPSSNNFDLLLAAHVTTPDATRAPMLLLGDPGAGKSLLMQVVAARLPASSYTVVRVPLRRVAANAPIGVQIQEALDLSTAGRVNWAQLSDQSVGTIRVVALDGLDELLQASSNDRSGYLQEVMAFQEAEAAQHRPIVVIVTSRIVVADRVDIPLGSVVVKLDNFTQDDIANWLTQWQASNAVAVGAGEVRALTLDQALRQPELAQQPLLLLMLALYAADPAVAALTTDLSTADLYRNLLNEFARREAKKSLGDYARGRMVDELVRDHLDRLAVAALAMFNRGRQDISAEEIGRDLAALDERLLRRSRTDEAGQLVIGEFFFVHAPEAQLLSITACADDSDGRNQADGRTRNARTRRTYEFLHATFGEFLVASYVMAELLEVAAEAFARSRRPGDPNDNLLFALLSHQPLAARTSALDFARQIGVALPTAKRRRICDLLEMLLESYRNRHDFGQFPNYRPIPADTVRQLACYSANLILLRVGLEVDVTIVPLLDLFQMSEIDEGLRQWRSMVRLWQSGLDTDGMRAMLTSLTFSLDPPGFHSRASAYSMGIGPSVAADEIEIARIMGSWDDEQRTRYGASLWDGFQQLGPIDPKSRIHAFVSSLIPSIIGIQTTILAHQLIDVTDQEAQMLAALIFNFLRTAPARILTDGSVMLSNEVDSDNSNRLIINGLAGLLKVLFSLPGPIEFDGYALARAVIFNPDLPAEVPELRQAYLYGPMFKLISAMGGNDLIADSGQVVAQKEEDLSDQRKLLKDILFNGSTTRDWDFESNGRFRFRFQYEAKDNL